MNCQQYCMIFIFSLFYFVNNASSDRIVKSSDCVKAGFFRNPTNCKQFYRCVDWSGTGKFFSVFHFDCPPTTVFDEALGVCNYPWATTKCHSSKPISSDKVDSNLENLSFSGSGGLESTLDGQSTQNQELFIKTDPSISTVTLDVTTVSSTKNLTSFVTENSLVDEIKWDQTSQTYDTGVNGEGIKDVTYFSNKSETFGITKEDKLNIETTTDDIFEALEDNVSYFSMVVTDDSSNVEDFVSSTLSSINSSSGTTDEKEPIKEFKVGPSSIYSCPHPGFFPFEQNCVHFYVCREILPGLVSAEQLFRCPDRYKFDRKTERCQRETRNKIECPVEATNATFYSPDLSSLLLNADFKEAKPTDVFVLFEEELDEFFNTNLSYFSSSIR